MTRTRRTLIGLSLVALLLAMPLILYAADAWQTVGSSGFSAGAAYFPSLALDGNGVPYVAYHDDGNDSKATVMKYDGGSWVDVGTAGFSDGQADYLSLAIDSSGIPYVAFQDYAHSNKITVMRFTGGAWEVVGAAGFTPASYNEISLAIGSDDTPYVAFADSAHSSRVTVMKYTAGAWVSVGSVGASAGSVYDYLSLALGSDDTPYVAYETGSSSGYKATVIHYTSSGWEIVGTVGFSAGLAGYISLALDSGNTPYVAYVDGGHSSKVTVMKYSGSSWENVGAAGFSGGTAEYTSLALNSGNTPYVAYRDWSGATPYRATVMKYNGSAWETVGSQSFSDGQAWEQSLALDGHDTPYVAYRDMNSSGKATVKEFNTALALTKSVSPSSAGPGDPITYTITFSNTGATAATGVIITETLSDDVGDASYASSGVALTPVEGSRFAWTAPDLAQNDGAVITITGVLTRPLAAGRLVNTVTLADTAATHTAGAAADILNVAPTADAGPDQTQGAGSTVTLDGSGSDDNGATPGYGWTQTGGSPTVTLSDPSAAGPTFTAPGAETVLTFTLTVTDTGSLTGTDEVAVTVTVPTLGLAKSVSPSSAAPGDAITYTIAFSSTGATTAINVVITDTLSTNISGTHYTSSGVTLTPVDGSRYAWTAPDLAQNEGGVITITGILTKPLAVGQVANTATLAAVGANQTAEADLTISNVAPMADAGPDQHQGADDTVSLDGSGSGDDNGDALTYGWTQTGGSPVVTLSDPTASGPTFTAPEANTVVTFTLTVTDTGSLTDTDDVAVAVTHVMTQYFPVVPKNARR